MQDQILEALRRGANDEALALARRYAQAEPDSASAHRMLAMALGATGDREGALATVDRALDIARDDPDLHFQRAALLAGDRDVEGARAALERSVELNPNQFGAYILQAQLALTRGDLDEAERLARVAARLEPEHPRLLSVDGMVALGRRRPDEALALLSRAAERAPEDEQVLLGLALAYIAKGHDAFAEQALRQLIDRRGGPRPWRQLLAETLQRQRRPAEALDALAPALDRQVPPATLRLAGELALEAGRADEALEWLRRAIAADPGTPRVLALALEAWRRLDDREDAVRTLESALATAPDAPALWQARLASVPNDDPEAARAVLARWTSALPDDPAAMEARMQVSLRSGDTDAALEQARTLAQRQPGHAGAHAVIVDILKARDPEAAIAHVEAMLPAAGSDAARERLGGWLAMLEDAAGRTAKAAARWEALAMLRASRQLPLPPVSKPPQEVAAGDWPQWSARGEPGDPVQSLFLWGPPGSCVEQVAGLLSDVPGFRADRMSPQSPGDVFQRYVSVPGLSNGELDPALAAQGWRDGLAARGIGDQRVIEWLIWWDNALLRVLRPHVERAGLLFVIRDPRDMLLQWAAFGSPMHIGLPSYQQAAWWLDLVLHQAAELLEQQLYRATLVRIDGCEGDANALAGVLSEALGAQLNVPPPAPRPPNLPAGHWRRYTEVLAEPFALLTPVAVRLGYPET
ncbi:tetratricopeptide repeat protein [Luteimonas kalidii]|uniref:Tetratricopeptide repeat protein n=1 Tax=Luteimonas kalidii TaxID=3042025 RepID=A0ABT6JSA7_9GAMM|nr:tetratricopeptide repeat protein [Luteimonas kalidii]MDH5833367.1 tetratricopeptide repeat protein [Luteimonas kalidii]